MFGSEFMVMQIAVKLLESLRYKSRMFGIPIERLVNIFCDNSSVVTNATELASTLKKKHNLITYHWVCKAIASMDSMSTKQ